MTVELRPGAQVPTIGLDTAPGHTIGVCGNSPHSQNTNHNYQGEYLARRSYQGIRSPQVGIGSIVVGNETGVNS